MIGTKSNHVATNTVEPSMTLAVQEHVTDEEILSLVEQMYGGDTGSEPESPDAEEEEAYRMYHDCDDCDDYDYEWAMGSGYWDSNGGSPQWVPGSSASCGNDAEQAGYWQYYDSGPFQDYHRQMSLELMWEQVEVVELRVLSTGESSLYSRAADGSGLSKK